MWKNFRGRRQPEGALVLWPKAREETCSDGGTRTVHRKATIGRVEAEGQLREAETEGKM